MSDLTTASPVSVANAALRLIGEMPIAALDDDREPARAAREAFGTAVERVLRLHPWRSALARASLAAVSGPAPPGFTAAFQLPADFLRLVETVPPTACSLEGNRLLANSASLAIQYVRRTDDMASLSPDVRGVIEAEMAVELSARLRSANTALRREMMALRDERLAEARHASAVESQQGRTGMESWVNTWDRGYDGAHPERPWERR